MTKRRQTIIYVDGENLLHRLIHLMQLPNRVELLNLNLRALIERALLGIEPSAELKIRFYTTRLRLAGLPPEAQDRLQIMADFNSKFIPRLAAQGIEVVRAGMLRYRVSDPCQHCGLASSYFTEKGVDVRLAVDMVRDAHEANTADIVIVSSDLDLLPAIIAAKDLGKPVQYLVTAGAVINAIAKTCNETIALSREQINEAMEP